MRLKIFLCHAKEDKPKVRELYRQLKQGGFLPWLDEEDLVGGQDWDFEIRNAVQSSDVVVVCLTSSSIVKKGYVQKEIRVALDAAEQHPDGQIFIIPVRLAACEIPERLSKWHAIDLFGSKGFELLERSLLTRTVVDALWRSSEDDPDAKRDLPRLKRIRAALASAAAPSTEEVLAEMQHSVKRLCEVRDFDSALQACMASRTLVSHFVGEVILRPHSTSYDQLGQVSRLLDESVKYMRTVKDERIRNYAQNVSYRAQCMRTLRKSLPRPQA